VAHVVWEPEARDDLDGIRRYIARDSPERARALLDRIEAVTDRLEPFPRSGRVVPEIGRDDIREVLVHGYRVIYRIEGDEVDILAVVHGARRLGDIPGL